MINEEALKIVLNDKTFGQRTAASIVGGRGRLYDLVGKGLIRCEKPTKSQNGKWFRPASGLAPEPASLRLSWRE